MVREFVSPHPADVPATAEAFLEFLQGPALLALSGRDPTRTRVLSVLMHGNEPSGLRALHAWLRSGERPVVDILVSIGAVEAASLPPLFSHRFVPGRTDLNRCFAPPFAGVEGEIAQRILSAVRKRRPEAVIDLHNNTGRNPIYGLGHRNDETAWKLVTLFTHRFVYSPVKLATFIEACQDDFPSVTIECGQAGDPVADAAALAGLQNYFRRDRLEELALDDTFHLFHTPARLYVDPQVTLAFADYPVKEAELTLDRELDRENFRVVPRGKRIGWLAPEAHWPFRAPGPDGREISTDFLESRGREIVTRAPWMPVMLTTKVDAAKHDCLCYLAEEVRRPRVL